MPRATIDEADLQRFELKSLPPIKGEEGGFVVLRKLSFGEILARRDMATKIAVGGIDNRNRQDDMKADIDIIQKAVTEFEMRLSIVDHNLEDDQGRKLNFANPAHIAMLSPQVGQEIAKLIDTLNDWDADLSGKDEPTFEQESEQQ